jgi:hypothetical protein
VVVLEAKCNSKCVMIKKLTGTAILAAGALYEKEEDWATGTMVLVTTGVATT